MFGPIWMKVRDMKVACKRLIFLLVIIFPAITPGFSAFGQTLIHRYSFISNANDEVGTANGTVEGGAMFSGGALVLNGTNGYVALPAGIVNGLPAVTIETWATFGTIANNSFLLGLAILTAAAAVRTIFFARHMAVAHFWLGPQFQGVDPGYTAEQEALNTRGPGQ